MRTMNISLPDSLKSYIDEQIAERGFGTASEYMRDLIREDRERQRLRKLLMDGAESGPAVVADDDYFTALRARVQRKAG